MSESTRKLAAIMFTDIVGYSKLVQNDEEKALDLLEEHNSIVRPTINEYNGKEIKTIGDAFLINFDSTLNALNSAIEIQKRIEAYNAVNEAKKRFKIRIGIHLGDILFKDNDVFGDGVNIASRIEPMASPGGICISDQVYIQVKRKTKLEFKSLGTPELKNIADKVEVYKVILPWDNKEPLKTESFKKSNRLGISSLSDSPSKKISFSLRFLHIVFTLIAFFIFASGMFWFMTNQKSEIIGSSVSKQSNSVSIAVLPFVNFSSDKENEYFSDGITEEILNYLAKIRNLRVISRTSVFSFKNRSDLELTEIGAMLEVNHILEGSVRKAGNKVRITAQLIRVEDDAHLWSETYDRELSDIFEVQDEIAQTIVNTLEMDFIGHNEAEAPKNNETSIEAYNLYLKGLHFQSMRNEDGLRKALIYFKKTVREDPNYELAYVGLANTYSLLADYRYDSYDENLPQAKHNANQAMELNPKSAEVQTANAFVAMLQGASPEIVEPYFLRAIKLNPNYATSQHWYSDFLRMVMNNYDKALTYAESAYNLDPLSEIISINLASAYRSVHELDKAEKTLNKILEINPSFLKAFTSLSYIYKARGEWQRAEDITKKCIELKPKDGNSWLDYAEVLTCRAKYVEAVEAYENAVKLTPNAPIPLEFYAFSQYLFGNNKIALTILEKAYEIAPELPLAQLIEGRIYFKSKDYKKAIKYLEKSRNRFIGLSDEFEVMALYSLGVVYAENGDSKKAKSIIKELNDFSGVIGVECMKGIINLYLGNLDKGMEQIKNAVIENKPYFFMKVDPFLFIFHNNKKFIKILNIYDKS